MRYFLPFCLALFIGCASPQEEGDFGNAHPYSDIEDSFMTQEPRSYREPNPNTPAFFFKSCSQTQNAVHYSKTSYICDDR